MRYGNEKPQGEDPDYYRRVRVEAFRAVWQMTIGSAQKGPGAMPAIVVGLLTAIIMARFMDWKTGLLLGAVVGVAVHAAVLILAKK